MSLSTYLMSIRVGSVTCQVGSTVDSMTVSGIREAVTRIVSECLYSGRQCTEPQALAAVYSVPNGAPLGMALDNVGPEPDDAVIDHFTQLRGRVSRQPLTWSRAMWAQYRG